MVVEQLNNHREKNKSQLYKKKNGLQKKWITDLNVKHKIIKLLEKKGEHL